MKKYKSYQALSIVLLLITLVATILTFLFMNIDALSGFKNIIEQWYISINKDATSIPAEVITKTQGIIATISLVSVVLFMLFYFATICRAEKVINKAKYSTVGATQVYVAGNTATSKKQAKEITKMKSKEEKKALKAAKQAEKAKVAAEKKAAKQIKVTAKKEAKAVAAATEVKAEAVETKPAAKSKDINSILESLK